MTYNYSKQIQSVISTKEVICIPSMTWAKIIYLGYYQQKSSFSLASATWHSCRVVTICSIKLGLRMLDPKALPACRTKIIA